MNCICGVYEGVSDTRIHNPSCPVHGDQPKTTMYISPCGQCETLKKSLEEQSRDYAARHIGFAKELNRLVGRIDVLEKVLSAAKRQLQFLTTGGNDDLVLQTLMDAINRCEVK